MVFEGGNVHNFVKCFGQMKLVVDGIFTVYAFIWLDYVICAAQRQSSMAVHGLSEFA